MNIHLDGLYSTEPKACSRACGQFFMGPLSPNGKPTKLNGAFHALCIILQFVVASAAEAKLGALFLNCQEGMIFQLTLEDLGHPQPKILVHCDNVTTVRFANNTIKRQCSRAMEMRYFWVGIKVAQNIYSLSWYPRQENLGNYKSKHHLRAHHTAMRPYYIHKTNSPLELPCALCPSTMEGCVGTLKDGYVRNVPLPQVPQLQSASIGTSKTHSNPTTTTGIPLSEYSRVPSWIPTLPKIGNILGFRQRTLQPFPLIAIKATNNLFSYAPG
jgi:hypothetical protein